MPRWGMGSAVSIALSKSPELIAVSEVLSGMRTWALWIAVGVAALGLLAASFLLGGANSEYQAGERHVAIWLACYGLVCATRMLTLNAGRWWRQLFALA